MNDYIKREDAIDAFRLWVLTIHGYNYTNNECAPVFASIPSADVVPKDFHDKTCEAMAKRHTEEIQRLMPKRGKPDFADCEKCSRTYGTFGCCSTVSNEWVYSCLEGMLEKAYADGIKSVEPKRGEWIVYEGEWKDFDYYPPKCKCNQCGYEEDLYILNAKPTNFCPNCGCAMTKE